MGKHKQMQSRIHYCISIHPPSLIASLLQLFCYHGPVNYFPMLPKIDLLYLYRCVCFIHLVKPLGFFNKNYFISPLTALNNYWW